MRRPEYIRHSAYKLMFYLGIVDVLAALVGGVLCGVIYIRGDIFCTNPNFVYIVSCFPAGMFSQYIVLSVRRQTVRSGKLSNVGSGVSKVSVTYYVIIFGSGGSFIYYVINFGKLKSL